MNDTAYPLPFPPPLPGGALFGPLGDVQIPSLEPFIAANLILAPNPWCNQPPAAYYKYPPRGASKSQLPFSDGVDDVGEDDDEEEAVAVAMPPASDPADNEGEHYFGEEYLDLPQTAASAHFPLTPEDRGEKRKRDSDEQGDVAGDPGGDITWSDGIVKRARGRPKGSRDSKPRDTSRAHRYRSAQSGTFVPASHADAVRDDEGPIADGEELRRRVLRLVSGFYEDLAGLLERSSAESVADCWSDDAISGVVHAAEQLASTISDPRPPGALATPPVSSLTPSSPPSVASVSPALSLQELAPASCTAE